jgi:hypothetical protein
MSERQRYREMSEFSNLTTNSKVFPTNTNSDYLRRKKIFYTITFTKKKKESALARERPVYLSCIFIEADIQKSCRMKRLIVTR